MCQKIKLKLTLCRIDIEGDHEFNFDDIFGEDDDDDNDDDDDDNDDDDDDDVLNTRDDSDEYSDGGGDDEFVPETTKRVPGSTTRTRSVEEK